MFENLSREQLEAILDALPMEFIFVDNKECLQYANKGEKRSRPSSPDLIGKDIRACHQPESLPMLEQFIDNLKTSKKDEEDFWILFPGQKILNRFLAVRDKSGKYLGLVEYLLDFKAMEELAEAKKDAHKRDYSTPPPSQE
ncbi:MAG: hypothetical protein HPY65_17470 [Syntrophaceae bacterium]|nr:hypothetical protein [Syntrophaceae bacterium]